MNMNVMTFPYVSLICIKIVSLQQKASSPQPLLDNTTTEMTLMGLELGGFCPSYRLVKRVTSKLPAFMFIMSYGQLSM